MFVENDGRRSTSVFLIEHTLCFISLILIAATYLHLAAIIHDHLTHPTSTKLEADLNFPDGINASAYSGWLLVLCSWTYLKGAGIDFKTHNSISRKRIQTCKSISIIGFSNSRNWLDFSIDFKKRIRLLEFRNEIILPFFNVSCSV